jgi:hypothetical protein
MAVVAMLGAANAFAKCPTETHEVTGRVVARTGLPVVDATVTLHWKDATGGGERTAKTSLGGSYRLEFRSSTLSGDDQAHGDICKATLSSVRVSVVAPAFVSESTVVEIKDKSGKADFSLRPKSR